MNLNELKTKWNDSLVRVEKRENTISKLCKTLNVNFNDLMKEYESAVKSCQKDSFFTTDAKKVVFKFVQFDDNDYEQQDKVEQLYDNLKKLFDLKRIANKNETLYMNSKNKSEINKIPVIAEFLDQWKTKAKAWYIENAKLYLYLKEHFNERFEDYKNNEGQNYRFAYSKFEKTYYADISDLTFKIVETHKKTIDVEYLEKVLNEEVENKYFALCERISSYVGDIKNVEYLSIGLNGELNGVVEGATGKAKIETISAGGYNIQCFHYRVLIKEVK